ncbi:DUF1402 family protein [Candidatus Endowatersipora endosymbiont of Watersipora subatra]|uniref:DUF1402 family protein n=1 Tax=Candidatus Endowatersipora endosymbiont of Watersipora subatra TaxID=3077946 RepID=UPI00312C83F8
MPHFFIFSAFLFLIPFSTELGAENTEIVVLPGNRNVQQPPIPSGSYKRTRLSGVTFESKYKKIRHLLAKEKQLISKIKKVSCIYDLDPIHIIGALVGEHTYNVDARDHLQSYYVKALAYLNQNLSFRHKNILISKFITRPSFKKCLKYQRNYDLWTCREIVWNQNYRGKTIDGEIWPDESFSRVFFRPFFAGQTFGLGQLNPLTALKVNDLVRSRSPQEPQLSVDQAPRIYNTIINPDSTLLYMAAILRHSIDVYRDIAAFDISHNPGLTATLYNLGNVTVRAQELRKHNRGKRSSGSRTRLPQENYYGWFINEKEDELRSLL